MANRAVDPRRLPVGSVRIRTRHKRGGEKRAYVKVAQPNKWRLRAHVVWESRHGDKPRGMVVHHRNGKKLDDRIDNLELLTKAAHLDEHRDEFDVEARARSFKATRAARPWSTKSKTKRTGRPPLYSESDLRNALRAIRGGVSRYAASRRYGVSTTALRRRISKWKS